MAEPFLGEIRLVGFNFAPVGWALCDGSVLSISQYDALFALIGTYYGGNGTTNFALPNLLGRMPVHMGSAGGATYTIGYNGGTETATLDGTQIPSHIHVPLAVNGGGTSNLPTGNAWAGWTGAQYVPASASGNVPMSNQATGLIGGNVPHNNLMPYQVINFIIALAGVFPSRG
jgi:microcystin-dependent protein